MEAEPSKDKTSRGTSDAANDLHALLRSARKGVAKPVAADDQAGEVVKRRMAASLAAGRRRLRADFEAGADPIEVKANLAALTDAVIQGALDFALHHFYRLPNPTKGEALAVFAVGGYGRGVLAPHSDVDLLFLHPYKRTGHTEQMAEFLLYRLWDLGLKVGQSVRQIDECLKLAKGDLTIKTSLLEARRLWGSESLAAEFERRFQAEVVEGSEAVFIEGKLAERDARHERTGDSRYLLEPNVKEGKGGLRDLHTLMWLGRFVCNARDSADLVRCGVLTQADRRLFERSRRFLSAVRCHLHFLTERAEERLTFDLQPEVARRMGYKDRPNGLLGVERFMRRYYLVAKEVGDLTRVVCSALEEQHRRKPRLRLPRFAFNRRQIDGFLVQDGRVGLAEADLFERRPIKMLELFHLAQARGLDLHPLALKAVARNLRRVDGLRLDADANRLFLQMLTSPRDPAMTLTRLNEAGLLGRFVPAFAKIIALMQYDLYHVYTTDEHTIRAIGALSAIEHGLLRDAHPLASELMPQIGAGRAELYLAVFLHDVGKGQGGNHSEVGARIAHGLLRRFALSPGGAETVEWLVRHHLVMSGYAFKRDLEDPKTIQDFVEIVQSPERLRLLLILTVCDIRAVGPNVWNGWKGQLLRDLYHAAEGAMASGDPLVHRTARIEAAKARLEEGLLAEGWAEDAITALLERHDPRYWLVVDQGMHLRHARLAAEAEADGEALTIDVAAEPFEARTRFTFYTADHPGLFMKLAGALALSGVSIVDAHVFTTADGMALDMLSCQEVEGRGAVTDPARVARIKENVLRALTGEARLERELAGKRYLPKRADVFEVEPRVIVNNNASRTHSVVEVGGRDRPGLLFELAKGLKELGLVIHSAHITTYGERVVDVFYVKDVFGLKAEHPSKLKRITRRLSETLEAG